MKIGTINSLRWLFVNVGMMAILSSGAYINTYKMTSLGLFMIGFVFEIIGQALAEEYRYMKTKMNRSRR